MTQPYEHWTVQPHGPLTRVEDNIMTVVGALHMPLTDLPRRMTVVRLADGRLVVFSAIALAEDAMQELLHFGHPAFMVVPNDHHRLDAKAWKARFPSIRVVAPAGAADKVAQAVAVDCTHPEFSDPQVRFITVPGTKGHEAALLVRSETGMTLVLNDLVSNIRHTSGFGGFLLRMMRFAGEQPHIPTPVRLTLVDDKQALREQLLLWAREHSLKRILVSHGDPIEGQPSETLRALAASL